MTYLSLVGRNSVCLAFLIAALDYLYILAGYIHNAYLNASKKRIFYAGDEWKSGQGKVVVIFRSIYLWKFGALACGNHLSDILYNYLGFQSYSADPDTWFKAATDKFGDEYYTYILVYVDCLIIVYKDISKVYGHVG